MSFVSLSSSSSRVCADVWSRRIDNEDKLREKVDEAMNVYDEYVKNSSDANDVDLKGEDTSPEAKSDSVEA